MKRDVLAIIPARGGSKGVKRKNIRELGGIPLIMRTVNAARSSRCISEIIVTTDDCEIAALCEKEGVRVIKRPYELAADDTPMFKTVVHALDAIALNGIHSDVFVLLQCTSPFRTARQIEEAVELYYKNESENAGVVSVCREEHPPFWLKKIDKDGRIENFIEYDSEKYARRQDFEPVFRLNGAIYVLSCAALKKYSTFQPPSTYAYVMDEKTSLDIDTEADFKYAELLLDQGDKPQTE